MRLVRRHRILTGVLVLTSAASIAVPVAFTQLGGAATANGLPANATYDEIQYGQQTGSHGNYMSFVPATSDTTLSAATQSMVGGGGCSPGPIQVTPGNPLLALTASLFPVPTPENVGAYKSRTGVCVGNSGGDQAVDAGQALIFQVSASSPAGNNRQIADAQVVVSRADKNTTGDDVTLLEFNGGAGGTMVASQTFSIPAGATAVTLDSDCGTFPVAPPAGSPVCGAGSTSGIAGFDTIELANAGPAGDSVAVVPTSIFYLAKQICGGQQLPNVSSANGSANVTGFVKLNITPQVTSTTCKSYTVYQDSANDPAIAGYTESFSFDSGSLGGSDALIETDWNGLAFCEPDSNQPGDQTNVGTCHPTLVSWMNEPPVPALYCASWADMNAGWNPANGPIPPGCIVSETVTYTAVGGGAPPLTNIHQTWDVVGDYLSRN